jgi:dolichol-phosphate mannosyltransferase
MNAPELSVVIPCYNEAANLEALIGVLRQVLNPLDRAYEIILIDDGSTDGSWELLKRIGGDDRRIRALRLDGNRGQSAACWAGMKSARGCYLVTLDADLQNDPQDLPKFLQALEHYDCVCGSRVETRNQGDSWTRVASSRIANAVRNAISGDTISDSGCAFRAFKRECIDDLKFFKGMHRFLPTLIKMEGFTVTEIAVANNPRYAGQSHYGVWNRLFSSFGDLLAVRWMKKRMFKFRVTDSIN